jgi:UDP-N-acetylmuramate-alanine ligase
MLFTVLLTLESKMEVIRYKKHRVFVDLRFGLPGKHNLMNALMAIAMAQIFGTPIEATCTSLSFI